MPNNTVIAGPQYQEFSSRVTLLTLNAVRAIRGCDAETVLQSVCNTLHPYFCRWVFNIAVNPKSTRLELRFWYNELAGMADQRGAPETVIGQILGQRQTFPRGWLEITWTTSAAHIGKLVKAGEITEANQRITRASLAAFLKRRLQ